MMMAWEQEVPGEAAFGEDLSATRDEAVNRCMEGPVPAILGPMESYQAA